MSILSMTGYGKAAVALRGGSLTVEIRTLNGKNADISIKSSLIPKDKDLYIRKKIADRLVRGTIDVFLTWEPAAQTSATPFDTAILGTYLESIKEAFPGLKGDDATLISALLRLPDVTKGQSSAIIDEENWPLVEKAFDEALDALVAFRTREGAVLCKDVCAKVEEILALYSEVESLEAERIEAVKAKLSKAIEELGAKPDPSRYEQELIYYLEKYDINEEKVRLRQHCKYFMDTIENEPCPGKKLGFIIQEMGREINTTGSKANHAGIQKRVVQMKDSLEKMREQSLNIL